MMRKRISASPQWFDINNYSNTAILTGPQWRDEIKARLLAFEILSKYRPKADEDRLSRSRAIAAAHYTWENIKECGLLSNQRIIRDRKIRSLPDSIRTRFLKDVFLTDRDYRDPDEEPITSVKDATYADLNILNYLFTEVLPPPSNRDTLLNPLLHDRFSRPGSEWAFHYVKVDISATDEQLIEDFRNWLSTCRQSSSTHAPRSRAKVATIRNKFDRQQFLDWSRNRCLPYLDLKFFGEYEGHPLTDFAIANALFPPGELNIDPGEKLRKTVRPKASAMFSWTIVNALERQLEKSGEIPVTRD